MTWDTVTIDKLSVEWRTAAARVVHVHSQITIRTTTTTTRTPGKMGDINEIAKQFTDFYYKQFDADRSQLSNLYVRPSSTSLLVPDSRDRG